MNVYEATQKRLKYIFNHYDNVLVAFSGGKDSGVLLNLTYEFAKENNMLHKVMMYHIDYEAQYQMTTDYVTETFASFDGIKKYWCCVPIAAHCACSVMNKGFWVPWQESQKNIWVRDMPESKYLYTEKDIDFDFEEGMKDYDFQVKFCQNIANKNKGKLAVLVGIRADESLNRWRATIKEKEEKEKTWITNISENLDNCYPICDWHTEDIWIANAKFGWQYNRLYDLFYQAGVKLVDMRVASPFNDWAIKSLYLYKIIDPDNWARMIGRVDGVNFAGLYGNTTAMGWRGIKLPPGHTWKSYAEFLLSTLPEEQREHYAKILKKSIEFWREKGGVLFDEQIDAMEALPDVQKTIACSRISDDRQVVKFSDYPDDVDLPQFAAYPSYKRFCVCILKNDYYCKYMGFTFTKEALRKRKAALEKYRGL